MLWVKKNADFTPVLSSTFQRSEESNNNFKIKICQIKQWTFIVICLQFNYICKCIVSTAKASWEWINRYYWLILQKICSSLFPHLQLSLFQTRTHNFPHYNYNYQLPTTNQKKKIRIENKIRKMIVQRMSRACRRLFIQHDHRKCFCFSQQQLHHPII